MVSPARRAICRRVLVLICVGVLAGCSAVSFTYERLPTLLYWWMNSYVDFDAVQAPRARMDFAAWHAWHRKEELPRYIDLLRRWQRDLAGPLDEDDVCAWRAPVVERMQAAFAAARPGLARLAVSLSDEQRNRLVRRFKESNAELHAEYAEGSPRARERDSRKRTEKFFRRIYGRLNATQRAQIKSKTAETAYDAERWLDERAARQALILDGFRQMGQRDLDSAARAAIAKAALDTFSAQFFNSPRAQYQHYRETLLRRNCRLFAEVHAAASPRQISLARRKLAAWEAELLTLTGQ